MSEKLLQRVQQQAVYNTACLTVTEGHDYKEAYEAFLAFVQETIQEAGCIEFFVVPSNIEKKEVMLWEVWASEEAFYSHMEQPHTKAFLAKNVVALKWHDFVSNF